MRTPGSPAALEARRRLAAGLLADGMSVAEVAEAVGASLTSVKRWRRAVQEGGESALAAKPHPGPQPRLSEKQRQHLLKILLAGARKSGYRTELWTCRRIAEVIEHHFGVKYHSGHVWRLLRACNWSPQRPQHQARERDEAAIERWRQREWPRIKKGSPQRS